MTPDLGPRPRIAVFRALQLGDLLCAVPALRALRAAAPQAEVTLIGLPWARELVRRLPYVDDFLEFPGAPGFPEQPARVEALPDFFAAARARRFDLALQLHGSGERSNAIVGELGARRMAAFHPDGADAGDALFLPWPRRGSEIHRCLALVERLGAPVADTRLELPLTAADHAEARALLDAHGLAVGGYVILHPGARLPSRRWPLPRYARVGRSLAAQGWRIVVTGSTGEAHLARRLAQRIGPAATDLCGRTSLGGLAALIAASRLLVCNDTGVSHVASALATPSVVVACGSEVERWAPLDRERHRVLAVSLPCRPCAHVTCPMGHACARRLAVTTVLRECARQLDAPRAA